MTTTRPDSSSRFVPVSEHVRERASRARRADAWRRGELLWLLAITLVAAVLRFWRVEVWSVSAAEAATYRDATAVSGEGWSVLPSFVGLLFESGLLPRHGEGWLRLPFLFAATLAVPLLALVGEALVGRRTALLAALLLALHPWHVEVCQTATGHGPALTLVLLGLGGAFVVRASAGLAPRAGVAAALAAAGACHPIGWLGGHAIVTCQQLEEWRRGDRSDRRPVVASLLLVLVLTILLLRWLRPDGDGAAPLAVPGVVWDQVTAAGIAAVGLAVLAPGWIAPTPTWRWLSASALVLFLVPAVLGATAITPAREHALLALPPVLLLAARAMVAAFRRAAAVLGDPRSPRVSVPAALVGIAVVVELVVGTFLYTTARRGSRPDWRGARDQIVRAVSGARLTVLAASGRDSLVYYLRPDHWRDGGDDPHPGIAVERLALDAPELAVRVATAAERRSALFVVLLQDELDAIERDADAAAILTGGQLGAGDPRDGFELLDVLPCAGTRRDETVYVFRARGER